MEERLDCKSLAWPVCLARSKDFFFSRGRFVGDGSHLSFSRGFCDALTLWDHQLKSILLQ